MIMAAFEINIVALVAILLLHSASALFTDTGCGSTKSCLTLPAGCSPSDATCVFFSYTWDGTVFEMELSGGAGNDNAYAAVGFAPAGIMKDVDTYYCTGQFQSAVIGTQHSTPTVVTDTNGLTVVSETTADGVAQCKFTRVQSLTKTTSAGATIFDLSSTPYFILLAQGVITSGTPQRHTDRSFTDSAVDLTATPSNAPATTAPVTQTTAPVTQAEGCGTSKGCFQVPAGCSETSADCAYFTWAYDEAANNFKMTISGGAGAGGTYAAVAFGQDDDMANADMYYCTGNALESAIITSRTTPTLLDISTLSGVTNIQASTTGGVASCSFTRSASITKNLNSNPRDFDLTTGTYYVLVARGTITSGGLQYHSTSRAISSSQLDLRTNTGSAAAGADIMEKVHGSLMIVAWLVLANLGTMIARHFKPLWTKTNPGGDKLWFQLHRFLMVTVFLCTAISFIIIFVHRGEYASNIPAHAIIGIIVMALTVLNPVLAIFRPHPNTPRRPIFNWTHYIVGTCLRALAIANLFQGVIAMDELPGWKVAVLSGFVGFVVLMEIIMEVLTYQYGHYGKSKPKKEEPREGELEIEDPNVRSDAVRGQSIKTALLIFTALGLTGFAIAYFVAIANA